MRRFVFLTALAALLIPVVPAHATHGDIHPTFKQEQVYFHCTGDLKVQNNDSPIQFSPTAPTESVEDGSGCGVVDPGFLINTAPTGGPGDPAFSGTFTGNLKNMTVTMYMAP